MLEKLPYFTYFHIREMSVLERCQCWRDVSVGEIYKLERCLY